MGAAMLYKISTIVLACSFYYGRTEACDEPTINANIHDCLQSE